MTWGPGRFALGLVLLATAGCDSPTEGLLGGKVYALTSVGGDALPTVVFALEGTTVVVLADTLRFSPDGRGTHVRYQEVTESWAPESPRLESYESEFGYGITGSRIAISYLCPPLANCVPGPHLMGIIVDGTVRLDSNLPPDPRVHVYELVDEG